MFICCCEIFNNDFHNIQMSPVSSILVILKYFKFNESDKNPGNSCIPPSWRNRTLFIVQIIKEYLWCTNRTNNFGVRITKKLPSHLKVKQLLCATNKRTPCANKILKIKWTLVSTFNQLKCNYSNIS